MESKKIVVDGVEYTRPLKGNRAIVIIDRGWIFAGDVTEANGRINLSKVVWVFRWESIGLDGVIKDPSSDKVTLKKMENDIDLPCDAEIFRIPVDNEWGLNCCK